MNQIRNEFYEHGELKNSLTLLSYGQILLEYMLKHECALSEVLNSINEACVMQVQDNKFNFKVIKT